MLLEQCIKFLPKIPNINTHNPYNNIKFDMVNDLLVHLQQPCGMLNQTTLKVQEM